MCVFRVCDFFFSPLSRECVRFSRAIARNVLISSVVLSSWADWAVVGAL